MNLLALFLSSTLSLLAASAPSAAPVSAILPAASAIGSTSAPDISRFIKIKWPGSGEMAPDGRFYYVFNPDGIHQLFRAGPEGPSEAAKQLTHFEDGIGGYALSDDGKHIAITAATGGSEQNDLYLLDTANDKLVDLFIDPKIVYGSPVWRRDSKAFAFRANADSPTDFHVYLYDLSAQSHRRVFEGKGHHYPVDFSRDGTRLLVGRYNSASFSQIFEVELDTQKSREITPAGEEWAFFAVGYDATDERILVSTNYQGDLKTLHRIELGTGDVAPILPDLANFAVDGADFNVDRTVLAVIINQDGYSKLHLFGASDLKPLPMPQIPEGIVGNVGFSGSKLLYSLNNANTAGIIYAWDMNAPDEAPKALTKAQTQGIDLGQFRLPELVHYSSFDGMKIPAFVYLPADYKKGQKIPFLVQYHGGPEGQYRPRFNKSFQYFLARGFGIIAPNVRGSSGYGKAYIEADNYKNRYKSVSDGVWAVKYVIEQGYTDAQMVGAWGGSYGGFMVMAVITEAPELFGAACNVVGICNIQTFLEQTKAYRRHLREAEYGPLSDPEFLRSISPIYNIDKIRTPLMLAHGLNDPRVPIGEALQVAVALISRGMDVEQLYFPDEGHGFRKEANQLLYYKHLADFFESRLTNKSGR